MRASLGRQRLCGGCSTNHPNGQILTPHYLLNDDGNAGHSPVIKHHAGHRNARHQHRGDDELGDWLVLAGRLARPRTR